MNRPAPIIRLLWAVTRDRNRLSKRLRDAIYERDRAMDLAADLRRDMDACPTCNWETLCAPASPAPPRHMKDQP